MRVSHEIHSLPFLAMHVHVIFTTNLSSENTVKTVILAEFGRVVSIRQEARDLSDRLRDGHTRPRLTRLLIPIVCTSK
jgi:hypothetical protein